MSNEYDGDQKKGGYLASIITVKQTIEAVLNCSVMYCIGGGGGVLERIGNIFIKNH